MPRIQGGRPGPGQVTFHIHVPPEMSCAEIASIGETLGAYVWYDDTEGGLFCWVDPAVVVLMYGPLVSWWEAVSESLIGLGAEPDEDYEVSE